MKKILILAFVAAFSFSASNVFANASAADSAAAPVKVAALQTKSNAQKTTTSSAKKKAPAKKSKVVKKQSSAAKPSESKPAATTEKKENVAAAQQTAAPSEQQPRAEAQKPVKPAVSMAETKAYELFKDANYDVAAPYFARMADEKRFVLTSDMSSERVDVIVKKYVDAQMSKFLIKGEFEKTAAYVVRVSEENRDKKIQEYANNIFEELKKREKKSVSINDFKLSRYYADDESFLLSSPNGAYVLKVEMAGARSFKSNFRKLKISDLDFVIDTSGVFVLSNFTLTNLENNKSYIFNSGMSTVYNISGLEKYYTGLLGTGTPRASQSAAADSALLKAFHSTAPAPQPATEAAATPPSVKQEKATATEAKTTNAETPAPATQTPEEAATPSSTEPVEAKVSVTGNEMTLEN
ncbi:MAG: hypothetical protein LBU92_04250 [Prevotellaceae bacterium]|nr:hypothetical protein [Prevotellaceae bacterium]